jgi:ribosomal protein S18 acetylase RimI-like enzyme
MHGEFKSSSADCKVTPLKDADWQAYRDFYMGILDAPLFGPYLEGKDPDSQQTWQYIFDDLRRNNVSLYCLWQEGRILGSAGIYSYGTDGDKIAELTGFLVDPSFRGLHLVDHLYSALTGHLKETRFAGSTEVHVPKDNTSSLRAAVRNGFVDSGRVFYGQNNTESYILVPK